MSDLRHILNCSCKWYQVNRHQAGFALILELWVSIYICQALEHFALPPGVKTLGKALHPVRICLSIDGAESNAQDGSSPTHCKRFVGIGMTSSVAMMIKWTLLVFILCYLAIDFMTYPAALRYVLLNWLSLLLTQLIKDHLSKSWWVLTVQVALKVKSPF